MKYGEIFENESVPEWSLHNIDYNALKHFIRAHTTKDQATAITIPGHQDTALRRFEDELYAELCGQHDRVGLFVASKADEIDRRLRYLSDQVQRLILRCTASSRNRMSQKRQRRFQKYERELAQCRGELRDLARFVNAQVVAFGKIIKKYKKWTGSGALGSRFKEFIQSNPKGFTRRDFHALELKCDEIVSVLRSATPTESGPITPVDVPSTPSRRLSSQLTSGDLRQTSQTQTQYWNEYDDGSEAGDGADGSYVIYLQPDEESKISDWFAMPIAKAKAWIGVRAGETEPLLLPASDASGSLLPQGSSSYGSTDHRSYFTNPPGSSSMLLSPAVATAVATDDDEEAFASDSDFPRGYEAYYAVLPSIEDQKIQRYREKVLFWGTLGSFATSFVLLGVAAILVMTGRHKLRVEVDAGATVGSFTSLVCACAGLGLTLVRRDVLGLANKLAIWATFLAVVVLNGMLLVLVVGNSAL